MHCTRTSLWSGKTRTRDLPVTQAQLDAWQQGMLIQYAMPQLRNADREFLISGMTEDEWQEMSDDT